MSLRENKNGYLLDAKEGEGFGPKISTGERGRCEQYKFGAEKKRGDR